MICLKVPRRHHVEKDTEAIYCIKFWIKLKESKQDTSDETKIHTNNNNKITQDNQNHNWKQINEHLDLSLALQGMFLLCISDLISIDVRFSRWSGEPVWCWQLTAIVPGTRRDTRTGRRWWTNKGVMKEGNWQRTSEESTV